MRTASKIAVLTVLFTVSALGMPTEHNLVKYTSIARAHSYPTSLQSSEDQVHHESLVKLQDTNESVFEATDVEEQEESFNNSTDVFPVDPAFADPDMSRTFQQIVEQNGFNFEEHLVTTKDGYILRMFRINGQKRDGDAANGKKVAFFQHGILDSADCWIMHKSEFAPAFILARAGYDVWLGNTRGNKYSKGHQGSISNYDRWNFDFETMGELDLTEQIEYTRQVSGQQKVALIAHSQGTTQTYFALATNEQWFADRVNIFIALGPVMQLTHCKSTLIHLFADMQSLIVNTAGLLGFYEFFPAGWVTTGAMRLICGTIPKLCELGLFLLTDEDPSLNDKDRTQVYLGHFPAGTSLRAIDHYGQILNTKRFQRMDFGSTQNKKLYGQEAPPLINLQNIKKVPIAMFVGTADQLATVEDNRWAKTQLSTITHYKEYPLGHMSFMIAKDMTYFTVDVMNILNQYHSVQ